MGIDFQGVSSFMALLAFRYIATKKCRFPGGGDGPILLCTGGIGPRGCASAGQGRCKPPFGALLVMPLQELSNVVKADIFRSMNFTQSSTSTSQSKATVSSEPYKLLAGG